VSRNGAKVAHGVTLGTGNALYLGEHPTACARTPAATLSPAVGMLRQPPSLPPILMRQTSYLTALVSVAFLSGCGAMLHGSRQDVFVQSSVAGTTVQASPSTTSVAAPGTISLERKNNYVLTFSAPGYAPATVNVTNSIGTGTVIADVLLTGLVGVVVDGMTGSWYGLNPETASVTLAKQVGTVGPDEIHIQLGHVTRAGQLDVSADAPGVKVEVTHK
jgi:hypothetical protein